MKEALLKIAQMSDCGSPELTILRMKEIASEALADYHTQPKEQVADADAYADRQGLNYPMAETYVNMVKSQIRQAYKDGKAANPLHNEGWISVEDRLPEDKSVVIFRLENNILIEGIFYSLDEWYKKNVFRDYRSGSYQFPQVTHYILKQKLLSLIPINK